MRSDLSLNLVKLVDPKLCETCRFARQAVATKRDGQQMRVIWCTRLDCDNWDRNNVEPIQSIAEVDKDE